MLIWYYLPLHAGLQENTVKLEYIGLLNHAAKKSRMIDLIGPSPARWMVLFEPQPHAHEKRHRHGQMKGLAALGALRDSNLASLGSTFTGHGREEADSIQKAHPPLCGNI